MHYVLRRQLRTAASATFALHAAENAGRFFPIA